MPPNLTTLKYNGFEFDLASVSFRGTAVYDQTGRTVQGHQMAFRCTAWVIGDTRSLFQTKLDNAIDALSEARKDFEWSNAGMEIFNITSDESPSTGFYQDRRYGPKPRMIDVKQIPGGVSAKLEFEIEAFINFCSQASDVEEFWWAYSYSFDRDFTCTRTVKGRYRVRSPKSSAETFLLNADLWPKVPKNFYRDRQDTQMSADGLQIDFTVVDKQVWRTLPRPLTDGRATFRIDQRMAQVFKSLSMSFSAPHDVNKKVIVQFIVALIRARFPAAVEATKKEWFTNFSVTNHEFENRVDVTVTSVTYAKRLLTDGDDLQLQIIQDIQDVTPDEYAQSGDEEWYASDGKSEVRGAIGTAGLVPVPSEPFDVCGNTEDASESNTDEEVKDADEAVPDYSQSNDPAAADSDDDETSADDNETISTEHEENTYLSFEEKWRFITTHNNKVLPVAAKDQDDIIQQTTRPQTRLIQVGVATRINEPPKIPQPAVVDELDPRVDMESVETEAPKLLADGKTLVYKMRWAYTILASKTRRLVDEADASDEDRTGVQFPFNPIYAPTVNGQIGQALATHRVEPVQEDGEYTIDIYPS